MSDSDMDLGDMDLGDLNGDDILDLGLEDDKFDLDGDGGFFLGEATKALDAAFDDISASSSPNKLKAPQTTVATSDNFLSRLFADREAELTIMKQPTTSSAPSEGNLARKMSIAALEAVASSVKNMAHLSVKRQADNSLHPLTKHDSSSELLDRTLAGRNVDPFASTMRNDENITDEEYTDIEMGRRKLKLLLQRFIRDYREHITCRVMVAAESGAGVELPMSSPTGKFAQSVRRNSSAGTASLGGFPVSVIDGAPLSCGEFELLSMRDPADGGGADGYGGSASPPPKRTLAEIKQCLKDITSAQEARVSRIKALLQDGEGGLVDAMFERHVQRTGHMVSSHAADEKRESQLPKPTMLEPTAEEKARSLYPSSSDSDLMDSLSISLADDSDEEAEKEKVKGEKKARKLARERNRREYVSKFKIEAISGKKSVSDEVDLGLQKTLEAMGASGGDGGDADIRGLAYAFTEQLIMIHEDIMRTLAEASDFKKGPVPTPKDSSVRISPLRRLGMASRADEFTGVIDAALQQGWEVLFTCLGAARVLPPSDFAFPQTLESTLNKMLADWRGAYQLSSLFALKFAISLSSTIGLSYCASVLKHSDAFQSRTIETAMVTVAEEALEGTLADSIVWIAPILAVMRMLSESLNPDLLVLALDVLMFAVLGAGNAAAQFVAEGGLGVLGEVLKAIDPAEVKPDVTKRILKLLNPTSLGVKPHSFLVSNETPKKKKSERPAKSTGSDMASKNPASEPTKRPDPLDIADVITPDTSPVVKGLGGFKAFPATTSSDPPPLEGITMANSLSHTGDDLARELMALEENEAAPEACVLSDDDYRDIIMAIEIALDKYDGLDEARNSQAQKEAEQVRMDAQKHKHVEAEAKAYTAARRRAGSITSMHADGPPKEDEDVSLPALPPSSADSQVVDECTFIVYSIMMVAVPIAVSEGVMQLLARHVIGSDVFWNNKLTMRGALGCVQTLLINHHAYEANLQRPMGGVGAGSQDSSALLEASSSTLLPRSSARRVTTTQSGARGDIGRMSIQQSDHNPNSVGYYRVIMDPPTLALLSLAVRCFSDVEIIQLPHVTYVYKALYQLVAAEPARFMLVSGCPDLTDDDLIASTPNLTRGTSMRKRVSISAPAGDDKDGGVFSPLRRSSHARPGPSAPSPMRAPAAKDGPASSASASASTTPPYNALIPSLLYTLSRSNFIHQKRFCISLLNKVIRGAYRPACLQLLSSLPFGIIFQPPLHQGRRSRGSIIRKESPPIGFGAYQHQGAGLVGGIAPPRPGLGGISSGAIATKLESQGAFLRFISKFIGTAPPELIPPLLALIREIGRFLAQPSSGNVFDQHLIQTILRSIVSIVQNYDQEVAVVAGGCMALGHLCRIPHAEQPFTFRPVRFSSIQSAAHSSSVVMQRSGSSSDGPISIPVEGAQDELLSADSHLTEQDSAEVSQTAASGGGGGGGGVASPQSPTTRIPLDVPTPTLTFALENEPLLDMAIAFINGSFIVNTAASNHPSPSVSGGAVSRKPSMQRVFRGGVDALGGEGGGSAVASTTALSPLGPSPVVRRTLGFLLAVLAMDSDSAQSIMDEGGLALLQEAGGMKGPSATAMAATPMKNVSFGVSSPDRRTSGAPHLHDVVGALLRKESILKHTASQHATAAQREEALASLLTREERELCKRQYLRLKHGASSGQHRLSTGASDPSAPQLQIILESESIANSLREDERSQWELMLRAFEKETENLNRIVLMREGQKKRERGDLEAYQMEVRRSIENFANDAFMDLVRYSQTSFQKRLTRAMSPSYHGLAESFAGSPLRAPSRATAASPPPQHYHDLPTSEGDMSQSIQMMMAAFTKLQEQQMRMQAELLLAVQQGAMATRIDTPPHQFAMASVSTAPLPPRPESASLRPVRNHPPPTFSRIGDYSRPQTPRATTALAATGRSQQPSNRRVVSHVNRAPLDPMNTTAAFRPATPCERAHAALASIDHRRERILTPHRPTSARGDQHHRGESCGAGGGRDVLGDSFIREDSDDDADEALKEKAFSSTSSEQARNRPLSAIKSPRTPVPPLPAHKSEASRGAGRRFNQSVAATIASNATVDELVSLMLSAVEASGQSEGDVDEASPIPPALQSRTVCFQSLTCLDLSRNYIGDNGLAQLIEILSLHRVPTAGASSRAVSIPAVLPHLSRLSLQGNGLSGQHLGSLLFEALGVPTGLSVNELAVIRWASPRPSAAFFTEVIHKRGEGMQKADGTAGRFSAGGGGGGRSSWGSSCDDVYAVAVVEGVVDFVVDALSEAMLALTEGEGDVRLALPCDHVTIDGVRVQMDMQSLSATLSEVVGRSIVVVVGPAAGVDGDNRSLEENNGAEDDNSLQALLDRLRKERDTKGSRVSALRNEESPFFRPIVFLDLSNNPGITPRCNRDLLAYMRLNPLLVPIPSQRDRVIVGGAAEANGLGLPRRPLSARTPQQLSKARAYYENPAKACSPLVLEGTSLFDSSISLVANAASQRARQMPLVMQGFKEVFSQQWRSSHHAATL